MKEKIEKDGLGIMMISTRGRYALRVMVDLAEHTTGAFTPLKEVAERQEISQKYLESIMSNLSKSGFVEGAQGKGGGYRLTRAPEDYKVGEILRLTEGALVPVACLEPGSKPCSMSSHCRTIPMWNRLNHVINDFFDSYTIADLMQTEDGGDYII